MRYSAATITAIVISFFTFLGMSLLVTSPNTKKHQSFDAINFSMIEEMESPNVNTPTPPRTLPEQKKMSNPPVAPSLDLTSRPDDPGISLPTGKATKMPFELDAISLNPLKNPGTGTRGNGDLIQTFLIEPQYPLKALKSKVEGWVKVEFTVNEFGKATQIKILESHPKHVFDTAVQRALIKSKFEPSMIDGKAVSQIAVQTVEFKIQE